MVAFVVLLREERVVVSEQLELGRYVVTDRWPYRDKMAIRRQDRVRVGVEQEG